MLPMFSVIVSPNLKLFSGILSLSRFTMLLVEFQLLYGGCLVSWLCHGTWTFLSHSLVFFLTFGYCVFSILYSILDSYPGESVNNVFHVSTFFPFKNLNFLVEFSMFLTFPFIVLIFSPILLTSACLWVTVLSRSWSESMFLFILLRLIYPFY